MKATEEDIRNGVEDEHGVIYSENGEYLLACRNTELTYYTVKKGCKIKCNEAFFRFMPFCSRLERIAIPEGVIAIGHAAFITCGRLREVVMPDSLLFIGESAFDQCPLTSFTIPSGLLAVGGNPFGDTCLDSIDSLSPHFRFTQGCLMNGDTMVAWLSDADECHVPEGTRKIGNEAFPQMNNVHTILLPEGLEEIGNSALQGSAYHRKITIPSSVRKMGSNPLGHSIYTTIDLKSPHFKLEDFLLISDKNVLITCMGPAVNIIIPEYVQEIGAGAFYCMNRLQSVTLPQNLKAIRHNAFAQCGRLTEIKIPATVERIEDGAFDGCTSLRSLTLPDGLSYIADRLLENSGIEEITIPNGVTHIGEQAFYLCRHLHSVTIPVSVKSIGKNAFFACDSLHDINIPNKDVRLGEHTFASCHKLNVVVGSGEDNRWTLTK